MLPRGRRGGWLAGRLSWLGTALALQCPWGLRSGGCSLTSWAGLGQGRQLRAVRESRRGPAGGQAGRKPPVQPLPKQRAHPWLQEPALLQLCSLPHPGLAAPLQEGGTAGG